jgi:hypothetical protein
MTGSGSRLLQGGGIGLLFVEEAGGLVEESRMMFTIWRMLSTAAA